MDIPEVGLDTFLTFLEYLYTDHSPIEDCADSIGILDLSNRYVLPRLTSLCELYIAKHVERATSESIAQADVDVIGMRVLLLYMILHYTCTCIYSGAPLISGHHWGDTLSFVERYL